MPSLTRNEPDGFSAVFGEPAPDTKPLPDEGGAILDRYGLTASPQAGGSRISLPTNGRARSLRARGTRNRLSVKHPEPGGVSNAVRRLEPPSSAQAPVGRGKPCIHCGRRITFTKTPRGRWFPIDAKTGTSHFELCRGIPTKPALPATRCHRCGSRDVERLPGSGPHAAALRCRQCGSHRWLPREPRATTVRRKYAGKPTRISGNRWRRSETPAPAMKDLPPPAATDDLFGRSVRQAKPALAGGLVTTRADRLSFDELRSSL